MGQGETALKDLRTQLKGRGDAKASYWISQLGDFLLGTLDEADLLKTADSSDAKEDRKQHSEAWYYSGMKRLAAGDKAGAAECFRKSIATERTDFPEYRFATAELKWLGEK